MDLNIKRIDLSDWLIHFIHDRNPDNDPRTWYGDFTRIPNSFDETGKEVYTDWDYYDEQYPIEPNAPAYSVLQKILFDGHIRAGWSFRNRKATIYGPKAAVCFTEMPLYALIEYAKSRRNTSLTNTYGLAILKKEAFEIGARQVIYGLSGKHIEADEKDPYYGNGYRCLSSSCGIGIFEQFRYVATNLTNHKPIDWTHEREWRWIDHFNVSCVPGLPIWIKDLNFEFSIVLVIVQTSEEAHKFVDKIKEYYDSGGNNFDFKFNKDTLRNTLVLAIDELEKLGDKRFLRIEELPFRKLTRISPKNPSKATIDLVSIAIEQAKKVANQAVDEYEKSVRKNKHGKINDVFGYVYVKTDDAHSEITQAFLKLNYAKTFGLGYHINILSDVQIGPILSVQKIAAEKAAEVLTKILGQKFYIETRLD